MNPSQAWGEFLEHLREITQLLRADPESRYAERASGSRRSNVQLASAITKACMFLTSARLQGCLASQTQEFLEGLDRSGITVEAIPEVLRGNLAVRFPGPRGRGAQVRRAIETQKAYAALWIDGTSLQPGTIRTGSLPDRVWNPWPDKAQELLKRCEVDLYAHIEHAHGSGYLKEMKDNVDSLVEFRNAVAHGDEPQPVSPTDVRLSMRWAIRLARASDEALAAKLSSLTGQQAWP